MTDNNSQQEGILRKWMNGERYYVSEIAMAVRTVANENIDLVKEVLTYIRTFEDVWNEWVNLSYYVVETLLKIEPNSTFSELYHIQQTLRHFFDEYSNSVSIYKLGYMVSCYDNAERLRNILSYLEIMEGSPMETKNTGEEINWEKEDAIRSDLEKRAESGCEKLIDWMNGKEVLVPELLISMKKALEKQPELAELAIKYLRKHESDKKMWALYAYHLTLMYVKSTGKRQDEEIIHIYRFANAYAEELNGFNPWEYQLMYDPLRDLILRLSYLG